MFSTPTQAYAEAGKSQASSRLLEADALWKTARLLEECQRDWSAPDHSSRLREALRMNQRLWTFFQVELTREDHELPKDLRRDLLRLSGFVDRRTFDVMAAPRPEKLTALIDINRHVAAGLSVAP